MTISLNVNDVSSSFPIPSSLHDLERAPYNLLPYPVDFQDSDEAARADSFRNLVALVERGNTALHSDGLVLFEAREEQDPWMDEERVQALYTLVRKSASLAPDTRSLLVSAVCEAVKVLSDILDCNDGSTFDSPGDDGDANLSITPMTQAFRDAFACHVYMLFSIMFIMESEAKVGNSVGTREGRKSGDTNPVSSVRADCAHAMLYAVKAMATNRTRLWARGVPDEAVVMVPCRIAFQMLESATTSTGKRLSSAKEALEIIACTVDSIEGLLSTIVAALVDLMHSYEHMAQLCVELCCMVKEEPTNSLAVELLREISRIEIHGVASGDTSKKASGIKHVSPFICALAAARPRIVLGSMSHLLPHLNSEVYNMRSSIVTAVSRILQFLHRRNDSETTTVEGGNESDASFANREKSHDALFSILTERVLDVSSFTRVATLKAWIEIVETGSLPVERFLSVTALAFDRLQDKTIMVRKTSMQLLSSILENNPYMGNLNPEPYREKLHELFDYIMANLPTHLKDAYEPAIRDLEDSGDEEAISELKQATLTAAIAEVDAMDDAEEYKKKVVGLKFTQAALDFIDTFEDGNAALDGMLLSSNTTEVTEALRFFVKAHHFALPCAMSGIKRALMLMWSTEQAIREETRKVFLEMFVTIPGTGGSEFLPEQKIAQNLLALVSKASVSELASIEEAISSLVKDECIPADVFLILWSVVSKGSEVSRRAAMQIIGMGAGADRSIVDSKSRLKLLSDYALGDYAVEKKSWGLLRAGAYALRHVERAKIDESCAKYLVLERVIEQLCGIARGDNCVDENQSDTLLWFSAAEEAIKAIFAIAPAPELASAEILQGMYVSSFQNFHSSQCHPYRMARFFHVLGHIALSLLVYTETLSGSVRQANAKRALAKQVEADQKKASKNGEMDLEDEEDLEAELGIAAELEAENERKMAYITETEILGQGLISAFCPLLVEVVANKGDRFKSEVLMQAAMLALCKCMCVSKSFCEQHLPLVFSTLAKSSDKDVTMRANTVVALGDLAFRFPNEVEPYTSRIYSCLRDTSTRVRRQTLMVLTHLILNDMVKVKGQVSEIALCLQDNDARIRDMAGLLFHELSKRSNNPIYNLLPDIISQLGQLRVGKVTFRAIMVFLLGYIKKERQNVMLTEKLCHRFAKAESISQKADLAFCIAQLKMNEKAIKCLLDNFKLYKDTLFDDDVKKSFLSLIAKAKKVSSKPEYRGMIEELEVQLREYAEEKLQDHLANENALRAQKNRGKQTSQKNREATNINSDQGDNGNQTISVSELRNPLQEIA